MKIELISFGAFAGLLLFACGSSDEGTKPIFTSEDSADALGGSSATSSGASHGGTRGTTGGGGDTTSAGVGGNGDEASTSAAVSTVGAGGAGAEGGAGAVATTDAGVGGAGAVSGSGGSATSIGTGGVSVASGSSSNSATGGSGAGGSNPYDYPIDPDALVGCRSPAEPGCQECCRGTTDDGRCQYRLSETDWSQYEDDEDVIPTYNVSGTRDGPCAEDCNPCAECSLKSEDTLRSAPEPTDCDCETVELNGDDCFTPTSCGCVCIGLESAIQDCPKAE